MATGLANVGAVTSAPGHLFRVTVDPNPLQEGFAPCPMTGVGKITRDMKCHLQLLSYYRKVFRKPANGVDVCCKLTESEAMTLLPTLAKLVFRTRARRAGVAATITSMLATLIVRRMRIGAIAKSVLAVVVSSVAAGWAVFNWRSYSFLLRCTLRAEDWEIILKHVSGAAQEKVGDAVASHPVMTRIALNHFGKDLELASAYISLAHIVAERYATSNAWVVSSPQMTWKEASAFHDEQVKDGSELQALPQRESIALPRPLRPTVEIEEEPEEKVDDETQKVSMAIVAPPIVEVTAGLSNSAHNTKLGLGRHLAFANLPIVGPEAEERLNQAAGMISTALISAVQPEDLNEPTVLPKKWGEAMREEMAERALFAERNVLKGHVKAGELMLPVEKLPRLIGNPGQETCAHNATRVGSCEKFLCRRFHKLLAKGLTPDEIDERMTSYLKQYDGHLFYSLDFSAMDSTWTLGDRERVKAIVKRLSDALRVDEENQLNFQSPTDRGRIVWYFATLRVRLELEDAILFSGERATSLGNRITVLILRTAEIIRLCGADVAREFWVDMAAGLQPSIPETIGDGDDETGTMLPGVTAESMTADYKAYGKIIEVTTSNRSIEVLSRYHFVTNAGEVVHLPKLLKNLGRLVGTTVQGRKVGEPVVLSGAEGAAVATAAAERAKAADRIPGFRQFCLSVAEYWAAYAVQRGVVTTKHEDTRMEHLEEDLIDYVKNARDMVEAVQPSAFHTALSLRYGQKFAGRERQRLIDAFNDWERVGAGLELCDAHFNDLQYFMQSSGIGKVLQEELHLSTRLPTCCVLGVPPASRLDTPTKTTDAGVQASRNRAQRKEHGARLRRAVTHQSAQGVRADVGSVP